MTGPARLRARGRPSMEGKPQISFSRTGRSAVAGPSSRRGMLRIGGWTIRTPCVWFGCLPHRTPRIWELLDSSNIMVNAASIFSFRQQSTRDRLVEVCHGIKRRAPLMMDSGGFQLQRGNQLDFDVKSLTALYTKVRPLLGIVLDYPMAPGHTESESRRRWKLT